MSLPVKESMCLNTQNCGLITQSCVSWMNLLLCVNQCSGLIMPEVIGQGRKKVMAFLN